VEESRRERGKFGEESKSEYEDEDEKADVGVLVPSAISPHFAMTVVDGGRKLTLRRRGTTHTRRQRRHFA
jgi:hypothetical protein